jgi:hypothetical protein
MRSFPWLLVTGPGSCGRRSNTVSPPLQAPPSFDSYVSSRTASVIWCVKSNVTVRDHELQFSGSIDYVDTFHCDFVLRASTCAAKRCHHGDARQNSKQQLSGSHVFAPQLVAECWASHHKLPVSLILWLASYGGVNVLDIVVRRDCVRRRRGVIRSCVPAGHAFKILLRGVQR